MIDEVVSKYILTNAEETEANNWIRQHACDLRIRYEPATFSIVFCNRGNELPVTVSVTCNCGKDKVLRHWKSTSAEMLKNE